MIWLLEAVNCSFCLYSITSLVLLYATLLFYRYYNARIAIGAAQTKREAVYSRLLSQLEANQEAVSRKEEITSHDFHSLRKKLNSKEFSPLQVLQCFQLKAFQVNNQVNCLTDPILDANDAAIRLTPGGPLYGIPVSIKDIFDVKGLDSTGGTVMCLNKPVEEDSVLVKVLRAQGAIPFVKTNNPQILVSFECHNYIFGQTLNPVNEKMTPGGSSGGEGALVRLGGSPLGWGSDIGGSLRIPAMFCGICTIKPTVERISKIGRHKILSGQTLIQAAAGPFAKDIDTLAEAMKAVLVPLMFQLDPFVPPIPFRTEIYESRQKLKIGFYECDDVFASVPAAQRAVRIAITALEEHGHTIVKWTPPDSESALAIYIKCMFGDGGEEILKYLRYDRLSYAATSLYLTLSLPFWVKSLASVLLKPMQPLVSIAAKSFTAIRSVADWWNLGIDVKKYRSKAIKSWRESGLDALICPGFACSALPIGYPGSCLGAVSYTALYNVLNFPAGSLPITSVNAEDIDNLKSYPTPDMWHANVKKGSMQSLGLPVGIQCVTLPFEEELCLRVLKELEDALKSS